MEIKLKTDDNKPKPVKEVPREMPADDFSDLELGTVHVSKSDVSYYNKTEAAEKKKSNGNLFGLVKVLLVLIIAAAAIKVIASKVGEKPEDVTSLVAMKEADIATTLKATFVDQPEEVKNVPQYSKRGKISVKGNEDISVVYMDNKQLGIKLNTKKYSLYNVAIGQSEYEAVGGTSYVYEDSFVVLDEMGGKSNTYFYYNEANNDCLAMTVSNTSNRIVTIIYYNNYKKISETLSSTY